MIWPSVTVHLTSSALQYQRYFINTQNIKKQAYRNRSIQLRSGSGRLCLSANYGKTSSSGILRIIVFGNCFLKSPQYVWQYWYWFVLREVVTCNQLTTLVTEPMNFIDDSVNSEIAPFNTPFHQQRVMRFDFIEFVKLLNLKKVRILISPRFDSITQPDGNESCWFIRYIFVS